MSFNEVKNTNVPCYKCEKRRPACHDSCKEYIQFKQDNQKITDAKNDYFRACGMFERYSRKFRR